MPGGEAAALEDGLHQVDAEVIAEVDVVGGIEDQEVGLLARRGPGDPRPRRMPSTNQCWISVW